MGGKLDGVDELRALLADGGVLVLTGAGISTESGIPDYRGPTGALRRFPPMTYQAFVGDAEARRRYWARSFVGWRQIGEALPNDGHRAVAAMQRAGALASIVTQNVDGLHQAAGVSDVVELHGGLDDVRCLDCGVVGSRVELGMRLRQLNQGFVAAVQHLQADGDAELADDAIAQFVAPDCDACGSPLLKPDVVFFGESVPPERVAHCYRLVDEATSMVVLGSSLTVFSGYRFARAAVRRGIPLAIVNQGPTRADELATLRVDAALGPFLSSLVTPVAA